LTASLKGVSSNFHRWQMALNGRAERATLGKFNINNLLLNVTTPNHRLHQINLLEKHMAGTCHCP